MENQETTALFPASKTYIRGGWYSARSGRTFQVQNPYDGASIAEVPDLSSHDLEEVVQDAVIAGHAWAKSSVNERSKKLETWYRLIREQKNTLGELLSREQGKPLKEAIGEVLYGASFVRWFSQECLRSYGRIIPNARTDHRSTVIKQPIGPCVAITPWNFPNAMITRKVAPALAAGCSIILKPAEQTPLSALALAALAEKAGIPPGLFQVVTTSDPASVGEFLLTHSEIRKVTFTGSSKVGRILMGHAARGIKGISLELGGNAPFIIFDDADMEAALDGLITAKFRNSGQTCISANRVFVQKSIINRVIAGLKERVLKLTHGRGSDNPDIGPLINGDALSKVERLVEDAKSKGAQLECGGTRGKESQNVYLPTLLSGMTDEMEMFSTEIFGPVLPLYSFETEEEVLERANNTEFGLSAYFYAQDSSRIHRVMEGLESGMVGVNTGFISDASAPFGGVKESGLGREGAIEGLDAYQEVKYICQGGL